MRFWAQNHVAAAFVVLYLALYAGYAATHSIGGGDQTSDKRMPRGISRAPQQSGNTIRTHQAIRPS